MRERMHKTRKAILDTIGDPELDYLEDSNGLFLVIPAKDPERFVKTLAVKAWTTVGLEAEPYFQPEEESSEIAVMPGKNSVRIVIPKVPDGKMGVVDQIAKQIGEVYREDQKVSLVA